MDGTYRIYTRWLAYELRKRGFKIVGTDINEYHPELTVWIFKDSPKFRQAMSEITYYKKNFS